MVELIEIDDSTVKGMMIEVITPEPEPEDENDNSYLWEHRYDIVTDRREGKLVIDERHRQITDKQWSYPPRRVTVQFSGLMGLELLRRLERHGPIVSRTLTGGIIGMIFSHARNRA